MQIFNDTPFPVATTQFRSEPDQPFLTLIVKATCLLQPDTACLPLASEDQPDLQAAIYHQDEHGNSLRREDEFAPFKPRADCIFSGSCYHPGQVAGPTATAVFAVGEMRKTLWVYGARHWFKSDHGKLVPSDPEAFWAIPIRNEFAHGGATSNYNKFGFGLTSDPEADSDADTLPLANIHNEHESHASPSEDGLPAGLGPLDRNSRPRTDLAGTFDDDWLTKRKPLPPRDFDYAYFNAARPDQQVEGYLRGDEAIYLQNLHPEHAHLQAQLPGFRTRCFLTRAVEGANGRRLNIVEAPANLDTCRVDTGDDSVTLIWRAQASLDQYTPDATYLHALIATEPLNAPREDKYYRDRLKALIQAGNAGPAAALQPSEEEEAAAEEKQTEEVMAEIKKFMGQNDLPPEVHEIVNSNSDPMTMLEKLIDHAKVMVDNLPKPPK